MSNQKHSARSLNLARRRVAVAIAILACPAVLSSPASAEPQPWHNPEYVTEAATAGGRCDQLSGDKTGGHDVRVWSTRSRCPVRTTVTSQPELNKAQIEYLERQAQPQPKPQQNKAQIEYQERLAQPLPQQNKAQIEYEERLAMAGSR